MVNMIEVLKRAQGLQQKMKSVQDELAQMEIAGEAGNGSVKVICDGKGLFKSIKLSRESINPDNPFAVSQDTVEMLEDLITAATTQATNKALDLMEEKLKSVTGGLNIPGLNS